MAKHVEPEKQTTEEMLRTLMENQAKFVASMGGAFAPQQQLLRREADDIANHERIKLECAKSAQQRTQEAADRRWPSGASRFRVCMMQKRKFQDNTTGMTKSGVARDLAFPIVEINADDADQARDRYKTICGILSHKEEKCFMQAGPVGEVERPAAFDADEHLPAGLEAMA